MQKHTRLQYDQYLNQIATLNDVPSAAQKFVVTPSVQQKLESKMQESSQFLGKINIIGVTEQEGEKLGLGIGGPVSSTTNTETTDRVTTDPSTIDGSGYKCTQTNFDTHIKYAKLDMWAKFADFQTRIRDHLLQRNALDRIMIGFNGTSRAATSNKVANALLQDVNIGWLQKIRANAPERWLKEVASASNAVQVGAAVTPANGYKNLDALVFDVVNELIDPWYREDSGLVVIAGRKVVADRYFSMVNVAQQPTEQLATQILMSTISLGALPVVRVPYFKDNALLITRLDNLSLYFQEGARRRTLVDNAKRDQIENYESSNDAFVIEDYGMTALVENIVLS